MLFVLIAIDKENGLPLRLATRRGPFCLCARDRRVVKLGGPFLDATVTWPAASSSSKPRTSQRRRPGTRAIPM